MRVISLLVSILLSLAMPALANETPCRTKEHLVRNIQEKYFARNDVSLEFRIKTQEDGQALVYWHLGGDTGSFYAVSFRSSGCAALIGDNKFRRFIFPKNAYNFGVFWSLDPLSAN